MRFDVRQCSDLILFLKWLEINKSNANDNYLIIKILNSFNDDVK